MRKAAVICEFNPFHNGHKFLIEKIKAQVADEVVCIMSGSFVQRGDVAITDKFARTKAALENGADMVVELPTVYAMAPAQVFALNGVRLAHELGCDCLCFGAENSIEELFTLVDILDQKEINEKIAAKMQAGCYYPRALSEAVGEPYAQIIAQPNNILALEYIRACREYNITPVAIERVGVGHNSGEVSGNIASATKLREMILAGEEFLSFTPMAVDHPASIEKIEAAVLYRLKTMTVSEIAQIADVSEGLENRIAEVASCYNSLSEILEHLKTKRYTMARLRRILLSAAMGVTREMAQQPVPYLRVLGVRSDKKSLIQAKSLPLIVDVRRRYDLLDHSVREIFDVDLRASALLSIAAGETVNEFSRGLILQ
jgi:cytidyltransferase-like protein